MGKLYQSYQTLEIPCQACVLMLPSFGWSSHDGEMVKDAFPQDIAASDICMWRHFKGIYEICKISHSLCLCVCASMFV